ncbi:MAG: NHLP bacteriocin export ABC transporter permease/ATPase subunit [Pseudomonadota bacterium]|nr:NHLP bacteriocin export ABC transporter permease/ATPase subunit [Pseudomonadota bacterium]
MSADWTDWLEAQAAAASPATTFRCDGPPRMFWVASGAVDFFLTRCGDRGARGARQAVARFGRHEAFLVADLPETLAHWEALLVPLPNTRLVELDNEHAGGAAHAQAFGAVVEDWIGSLVRAADRGLVPARYRVLESDQALEVASDEVAAAATCTVWAEIAAGEVAPFGDERLRVTAGALLPMHPEFWVTATTAARLVPVPFARLCEEGRVRAVLAVSLGVLLKLCVARVDFEAVRLTERLDLRRGESKRALRGAFWRLRALFGAEGVVPPGADTTDPVIAACRVVGAAQGIVFPELSRGTPHLSPTHRLEAAVASGHIRQRRVALRGRWWETDSGPLLAFVEDGEVPVALLPAGSRGYEAIDPATGAVQRVDAEFAARLQYFAHSFFRAFPNRRLGVIDLLRFGFAHQKRELVTIVATAGFVGMLGMLVPIGIGLLFDEAIPATDRSQVFQISAALLGAAVATLFFTLARSVALLRLEGRMDGSIQAAVWDRVLKLPVTFFRSYEAGDLAVRINAINTIRQNLSGATLAGVLTGVFSVFNLVLLFVYEAHLALLALAIVAVAVGTSIVLALFALEGERPLARLEGRLSAQVLQYLTGIAKLRVAAAEARAFSRWAAQFAEARGHAIRAETWRNVSQVFLPSFMVLASALLYYIVAQMLAPSATGRPLPLTTGAFVAFSAAFGGFLLNFALLSEMVLDLLRIVPQVERARPLLEAVPEVGPAHAGPGPLRGEIHISNVVFRYRSGGPTVLDGVSFSVRPGEFVAIVGPSGSGKSTLIRLLLGFEKPESGSIYYDRKDLADLDPQQVRGQFGVVLQTSQLMPGDIFNNIIGAHMLSPDDAWEAARMCGLDADIEAMPMGMYTVISEGANTVSGGQRQRILIARAIVRRPRILLFDEATSALDNRTQATVARSLERLKGTRIVIAHRLTTIMNANRIIVLDAGRIVQSGTYAELIAQPGLFADLAHRQMA